VRYANGSGLAAMKEEAKKWNTPIIKESIVLKNEGH